MKKLIIIGAGGLGREVAQYVEDINNTDIEEKYEILGFVDDDETKKDIIYNNIRVLGGLEVIADLTNDDEIYTFCAIANPVSKKNVAEKLKKYKCQSINLIHPTAYIANNVILGTNVLVAPLCVLTTNIIIGSYVHLNPQCGIGHDTVIDDYVTCYWSVNTGGFVHISEMSELGSKTFIKQNVLIGKYVVSGAGAVIVKNIPPKSTVKGVPAV